MNSTLSNHNRIILAGSVILFLTILLGLASPSTANDDIDDPPPTPPITTTGTDIPVVAITTATPTMDLFAPNEIIHIFLPFVNQSADTPTPTPTPSSTPTPTPTLTPSPAPPPETLLFCDNLASSLFIPDNNPTGISNQISINDPRQIVHLSVYVDISHTWVSDLTVSLSNLSTGETQTLIDRPGYPQTAYGCDSNNIISILDDRAEQPVENQCYYSPAAISGAYQPNETLQRFIGSPIAGPWRLRVIDSYVNDTGYLNGWCLEATIAEGLPPPTPTPPPTALPASANVAGMSGENQQLPLDCESRSAVDWAAHFGAQIDELDFYYNLPHSDDPDAGFVGNVSGIWGQIPPDDYGVHAIPIAALLNDYGLPAYPKRALDWDTVRAEIANGDPVIVWIIGDYNHSLANGIPRYYTAASNEHHSVVAAFEHTVIVTGYTESLVTVLNGAYFVTLSLDQFLDSWSALWNMAVLANP
jgi:subtilisin-like proprotein convertase family protein